MMAEPGTTLTDLLLAAVAAAWGVRLWRDAGRRGQRAVRWWAGGFFATAVAALLGALSHGFGDALGPGAADAVWVATLHAVGAFAFCAAATAATAGLRAPARRPALMAAAAGLAVYLVWILDGPTFGRAIVGYGIAMVALVVQQASGWLRSRAASAPWILAGVAVVAVASALQRSGISLHPVWFDHNALYHVIQLGAAGLFYLGGLRLEDRS